MNMHTLKFFGILTLVVFILNSCFKDDLLKEIDVLKTQVSDIKKRNDSLNNVLNVRADSLAKALTSAQKRSDSLSNVLRTKSDSLSLALGLTNVNLANLTKSVDSIKVQVANINGQLTQLNSQLTSVTTQLTQLNQQFGALGADYATLNAKYQELSASLQGLNTQIAALQAEQLKLLERLNAIFLQLNPPVDITTGLVAYFPFSGNAGDSSGNGNHGTVIGATLTADRLGKLNSAMEFSGISYISGSASIFPSGNNPRSVSIWFNSNLLNNYTGIQLGTQLFGYGGGACGSSFIGYFARTTFNIEGHCAISYHASPISYPLIAGWHNVTITFNGLVSDIYLDGVKKDSKSNSFNTNVLNKKYYIGMEVFPDGLTPYTQDINQWLPFNGKLDDVRIYNRALTQEQITYLATH